MAKKKAKEWANHKLEGRFAWLETDAKNNLVLGMEHGKDDRTEVIIGIDADDCRELIEALETIIANFDDEEEE
jgi:hypothetical protein